MERPTVVINLQSLIGNVTINSQDPEAAVSQVREMLQDELLRVLNAASEAVHIAKASNSGEKVPITV